jgi:esterase
MAKKIPEQKQTPEISTLMPVKLNYNIYGNGETIIILHGLFGSSRNWQGIAKKFSGEYRVITVDLRNHGQSGSSESMTYPEMADDIYSLMSWLSIDSTILIGHSMGGKVAMMTALNYQMQVSKLIVLDIAPVNYGHRYEKIFTAMNRLPLDKITGRNEAEVILNKSINDDGLTQFLLQNLTRSDSGFQWRINLATIEGNIELINSFPGNLDGLTWSKPAMFLGGQDSMFLQAEYNQDILKLFPAAEINLIENTGHMLHIEQPVVVYNKIGSFLHR